MKTRIHIFFNFESKYFPLVQKIFRKIGRHDLADSPKKEFGYGLTFEDEIRAKEFISELSKYKFTPLVRKEYIYSVKELEAAPLLCMIISAEQGEGGPRYGTKYDLSNACKKCGTGAIQTSLLYLNPSEIPRKGIFQTLDGEYLVSGEVSEALQEAGVTGLELRHVVSYRGGKPLPWFQMISDVELPLMDSSTRGVIRSDPKGCDLCGKDGYFHSAKVPLEIAYKKADVDVDNLPDIVHTYEHFGISGFYKPAEERGLASPMILIKPRVMRIFKSQKVRNVEYLPVKIID